MVHTKNKNMKAEVYDLQHFEELKKKYTIVMVTHNMQQALRIADKTAFFLMGEVVEYDDTEKLFSNPIDKSLQGIEYINEYLKNQNVILYQTNFLKIMFRTKR